MKKLAKALSALIGDSRRLIAACYALFFAGSVLAAVLGWAEDGVQRLLGNVAEAQVTVEDFDLVDIEREGDICRSTSYDPRMTLRDAPAYVRTVTVRAEFTGVDPGEFCVFYKPAPGMEEFDANYREWAHQEDDGSYTFTLPASRIYGLRIDPGIYEGVEVRFESITLNAPRSLAQRLAPTRPWLLAMAVAPLLIAAALRALADALRVLRAFALAHGKKRA